MTTATPRKITDRQRRFVEEYLVDLNGAAAAVRAGYTKRSARQRAHELLSFTHVQDALQDALAQRSRRIAVTQDRVLEELARLAFADSSRIVRFEQGQVKIRPTDDLTDDDRRTISGMSETQSQAGGSIRIRFHDKVKALELLGRHLGMFLDRHEFGSVDGAPLVITVKPPAPPET